MTIEALDAAIDSAGGAAAVVQQVVPNRIVARQPLRRATAAGEDAGHLRVPPHALEAEQGVLGALLLDNAAFARVAEVLSASDFYRLEHKLIFGAIATTLHRGEAADVLTVWDQLEGEVADCGGLPYLNQLVQDVPSAPNVLQYAEIVRDRSRLRALIGEADRITAAAFEPGAKAATVISEGHASIARLALDEVCGFALPRKPLPLDLPRLGKEKAPPRHWFRSQWMGGGAILLSAKGGDGKSTLVQHEITCGGLGRPYFAPECQPYRSLYWNCEDEHDELWRRQEAICEHEQIDMASLEDRVHIQSRYGCDNALMFEASQRKLTATPLLDELRQQVNDLRIDVLWLDNVAHLFLGNHDDRTQVTQFINLLNGVVRGRPFGVCLVAHVSRAQGSEFSGSVAWENAARMRWYLGPRLPDQKPGDDDTDGKPSNVLFLARRKANYSAKDYVRFTMQKGLLVPDAGAAAHVDGIVSAMDERRAEEVCIAGFKSLAAMGIRTTDGKTSPDYLPSQMVAKGLATGYSKSEIGRAMNRLMGRKVFIRAPVGQHSNRSPKFGLVFREDHS